MFNRCLDESVVLVRLLDTICIYELDLDEEVQSVCRSKVEGTNWARSQTLYNLCIISGRTIVHCGGFTKADLYVNKCYTLDLQANVWRQAGFMNQRRGWAGYSIHPKLGLFISGGITPIPGRQDGMSALVQSTMDGTSFTNHAGLPTPTWGPCQVRVIL